jgi:hypothetical protein
MGQLGAMVNARGSMMIVFMKKSHLMTMLKFHAEAIMRRLAQTAQKGMGQLGAMGSAIGITTRTHARVQGEIDARDGMRGMVTLALSISCQCRVATTH